MSGRQTGGPTGGDSTPLEIERKYLLAEAPSAELLARFGARPRQLEQVYLRPTAGAPNRRIRRTTIGDRTRYHYTEKRTISGIVREEREGEIDARTWETLLAEADPERHPVRKTRWVFPYAGHELELDVFEDPPGIVLLEVELSRADEPVELPPELAIVRDVSEDREYLNWSLARR